MLRPAMEEENRRCLRLAALGEVDPQAACVHVVMLDALDVRKLVTHPGHSTYTSRRTRAGRGSRFAEWPRSV